MNIYQRSTYEALVANFPGRGEVELLRISNLSGQPKISVRQGLKFDGAYADHILYIKPTSLATGKRAIRIGDWGTEVPLLAGDGLIRSYSKVISGTDDTVVNFHWAFTISTGGLFVEQIQAESQAATPGPKAIQASSFLVGIASGKYLAASVSVVDGLVATWHKVYASVDSVCNGNVAAIWLDNQMSCTVGGIEASIKASTGGSVPDGFIWLNTTSSGWAALIYFDATMVGKAPLSAKSPTTQTYPGDGSIILDIAGTLVYVPYYLVAHVT